MSVLKGDVLYLRKTTLDFNFEMLTLTTVVCIGRYLYMNKNCCLVPEK